MIFRSRKFWLVVFLLVTISAAYASGTSNGHASTEQLILPVLIALPVLLTAAKIGGHVAARFGQPPVLGELIIGVVIGNLGLLGFNSLGYIADDQIIGILAEIGVILLLFTVGLESNLDEMVSVGVSSLLVATVGVIAPFFLGWGVAHYFLPHESIYAHIFVGATLCATSVGITARVLKDLGKIHLKESKIILGAAVIDDIQGLVILAVVQGIILAANTGGTVSSLDVVWIIGKAVIFLGGSILVGGWAAPRVFRLASFLQAQGLLLAVALSICFLLAWIAGKIHLAPIVGAFTAGLLLDEVHYKDLADKEEHSLEELVAPIAAFLVPVFFVLMGIKVELASFANTQVLGFATIMTVAAVIGKQACSLGVLGKGLDRLSVGIGMVPRGEVGLIFAATGMRLAVAGHKVISQNTYSAIVVMVIITTLITPPLLRWSLIRSDKKRQAASEPERVESKL